MHLNSSIVTVTATYALIGGFQLHASPTVYTIGNSLTWDTIPSWYATDHHIYCGQNLSYIYANPAGECVSSTRWTSAFTDNEYDFVTVQPYNGTTLSQDVEIISTWMDLEPGAVFVVHSGWAQSSVHSTAYNAGFSNNMVHSPEYFEALINELSRLHPGREIRFNPAIEVLELINQDAKNGIGPFTALADVYRDAHHMTAGSAGAGRYLMHNLMRQTLGLATNTNGFESVPATTMSYLDDKIRAVRSIPEPTSAAYLSCLLISYALVRRMQKCRLP